MQQMVVKLLRIVNKFDFGQNVGFWNASAAQNK